MDDIIIRMYRDGEEKEINDLFNSIFNEKRPLEEWIWKFKENPLSGINLISVAEIQGEIVGQYACIPCLFKYKDMIVKVSYVVDNFVLPEFRGGVKGTQWRMFRHDCEISVIENVAFGMGFPNREAYIIGKRFLKYSDFGSVPVLFKRLNWRLSIEKRFPWLPQFIINITKKFSNLGYKILISTLNRNRSGAVNVRPVDSFDHKFDAFWEKVKGQYGIIGVRDRRYLEWRYRKPGKKHEIFIADIAGEMVGYMVLSVRKEEKHIIGYIMDILVDERVEAGSALVRQALLRFLSDKVDYVRCWMMQDKKLYKTLREYGFVKRDGDQTIKGVYLIFDGKNIDDAYIGNSGNWYLSMGDSDTY
jgi:hypothetical protein